MTDNEYIEQVYALRDLYPSFLGRRDSTVFSAAERDGVITSDEFLALMRHFWP